MLYETSKATALKKNHRVNPGILVFFKNNNIKKKSSFEKKIMNNVHNEMCYPVVAICTVAQNTTNLHTGYPIYCTFIPQHCISERSKLIFRKLCHHCTRGTGKVNILKQVISFEIPIDSDV